MQSLIMSCIVLSTFPQQADKIFFSGFAKFSIWRTAMKQLLCWGLYALSFLWASLVAANEELQLPHALAMNGEPKY